MARRRNNLKSEVSGSLHFDTRTKTVIAEASQENIKEKVQEVREVIRGKSNNEIIMVLQYYENNVEKAIQAYLEDGAKEALQEWNFTGYKQSNKQRRNKRKGNGEKPNDAGLTSLPASGKENVKTQVIGNADLPNGDNAQAVTESFMDSSPKNPSSPPVQHNATTVLSSPSPSGSGAPISNKDAALTSNPLPQRIPHIKRKEQEGGMGDGQLRKPPQGLEKAIKDLHRQTTSLERLRHLLDHEIDRSYKSVKSVFEELRQGLNDREAKLMTEMSVLKEEASNMLEMRQSKAADLKRHLDRSDKLKDSEITQLRAEIKHFVSERRHDEDLGRTTRFLYDSDHMMEEIRKFGEVVHIKSMYTTYSESAASDACNDNNSHEGQAGNLYDDHSHLVEVHDLQDRLTGSLNLENSPDKSHAPGVHLSSKQNGSKNDDFVQGNTNHRQQQIPRQSSSSDSTRGGNSDSVPSDIISNSAMTTSTPSSVPPGNSDQKSDPYSSNREPSYSSRNFGSQNRGWYGGNTQGSRGRGRGRGIRGEGRGRVVYSSQRS